MGHNGVGQASAAASPESIVERYAVLKPGGAYRKEAVAFMRKRLGDDRYNRIVAIHSGFAEYPYVVAKLFLSVEDWNKYAWIEWHGTLEGYDNKWPV